MIPLGKAAKWIRTELGLSQRAAAKELEITAVHLCNIERGHAQPSPPMMEKFREAWGIDLYMIAAMLFVDREEYPLQMHHAMNKLERLWRDWVHLEATGRRIEVGR